MESSVIAVERPLKIIQIDPSIGEIPYGMGTCRFFGKISRDDGTDYSPGVPSGVLPSFADDKYEEKVARIVGNRDITIYADCDHSGRVVEVLDSSCSFVLPDGICLNDTRVSFDEMNQHRVVTVQGDAITSPHFIYRKNLIAGGRDCLMIGAVSQHRCGIMHGSVGNLFGYKKSPQQFLGPLLDRFLKLFDAKETQLFIGPSIRVCCYQWNVDDAITLEQHIRKHYPTIGTIFHPSPTPDENHKCYVDLISAVHHILTLHGYGLEQIWCSEVCTFCNTDWHSQRRDGNSAHHRPRNWGWLRMH